MQVLVTGATGMVGRCLVEKLVAQGVHVRAVARATSDTRHLQHPLVEIVTGQVDDAVFIGRITHNIDTVFHVAGHLTVSAPFGAHDQSPEYDRVNVTFTEALLAAALHNDVKRFVYVSSSNVYAPDVAVPTPEDAPLAPQSAYGRSKLAAERLVQAYQQRGLATTIIRPTVIYGPGDRYFTPAALKLARLPILPLIDGGQNALDMVFVQDVAELIWLAARAPIAVGRVYNAGAGSRTSLAQLVAVYRALTGRGPRIIATTLRQSQRTAWLSRTLIRPIIPDATAALSPDGMALMARDVQLDITRARDELGFTPQFDLQTGLALTLPYFQQ